MTADDDELERWPPFIAEAAAEALGFAARHPRAARSQSRVVAEAICSHVYRREIGEPGKLMLDELVRKLAAKKLVSPQVELPLRTVQAWGNYRADRRWLRGAVPGRAPPGARVVLRRLLEARAPGRAVR